METEAFLGIPACQECQEVKESKDLQGLRFLKKGFDISNSIS